jgi:hypothetical protein
VAQSQYRNWDEFTVVDFFNSDPDYCLVAEVEGKVAVSKQHNHHLLELESCPSFTLTDLINLKRGFVLEPPFKNLEVQSKKSKSLVTSLGWVYSQNTEERELVHFYIKK